MEAPNDGDSHPKDELGTLKKHDHNQLRGNIRTSSNQLAILRKRAEIRELEIEELINLTMTETFHSFFHLFPDLPKELRLKIWEQAMIEARPNRRILIYDGRVVPFKQFISPLLLVNYESRKCAKAFYNVKLDIYAVRPVTKGQVKHMNKQKNWDRIKGSERAVQGKIHGYTDEAVEAEFEIRREKVDYDSDPGFDVHQRAAVKGKIHKDEAKYTVDLEDHWSHFVRQQLRILGASSIRADAVSAKRTFPPAWSFTRIPSTLKNLGGILTKPSTQRGILKTAQALFSRHSQTSGPTTGAFYISPEHDVFITDYDCRLHFSIDSASKILGADFPNIRNISCNHVSEKLSAATCQRVSTLVIVRLERQRTWVGRRAGDKHCVFASQKSVNIGGKKYGFKGEFSLYGDWCWSSERTWKKNIFPNVRTHFILKYWDGVYWDGVEDVDGFLTKLTGTNHAEFYKDLELWEMDEFEEGGLSRQAFRRIKSKYDTDQIDWVRDLMAHWHISK